jgi:integrase
MGLGKQARTLSKGQIDAMLAYLSSTRHHAERNRLLSVKAGLRAKEVARLTWLMTNDSRLAGPSTSLTPPARESRGGSFP